MQMHSTGKKNAGHTVANHSTGNEKRQIAIPSSLERDKCSLSTETPASESLAFNGEI